MIKLSTSTNILFNRYDGSKVDVKRCILMCKNAGFNILDFNLTDYATIPNSPFLSSKWERWISEIKTYSDNLNIKFLQGHATIYNFCSEENNLHSQFQIELLFRSIDAAKILNIEWLVMHAGTIINSNFSAKDNLRKNVEMFERLLDYAAKRNVGLAIENMWDKTGGCHEYTTYVDELVELVEELKENHENVGICWDFEHGGIMNFDQRNIIKKIFHLLKATHISDYYSESINHILPFYGNIRWSEFLPLLGEKNYQGCLSLEAHNWLSNCPEELLEEAMRHTFKISGYLLNLANGRKEKWLQ